MVEYSSPARAVHYTAASFIITPYSNPYGYDRGLCSKILMEAYKKMDSDLSVLYGSIGEAMDSVIDGKTMGLYPLYPSDQLPENLVFSKPLTRLKLYAYRRVSAKIADEISGSAKKTQIVKKICMPKIFKKISGLREKLDALYQGVELIFERYPQTCFINMRLNKIDLVVDEDKNALFATDFIYAGDSLRLEKSEKPLYETSLHMAFDQNNPETALRLKQLDTVLEEMRARGELEQIEKSFIELWQINNAV